MSQPPPSPDPTERVGPVDPAATERILPDARQALAEPLSFEHLTRHGARIGEYRVLGVIGRGGMGVVLLAEQLFPVQRQVALKLLAGRRMDGRAQAWFEVERQLLARMQHPAVAQIFDAGTTPEGLPYFSMELVEGDPLTHYADQHRLQVNERLALFRRVCLGVHHAHARGIIHRDLKPANILVASIDGVAMPKIIDFGIAALQTHDSDQRAPPAGTLPYMSPEQLARSGDDVDPRADVFALGVVLFELLTGERPYGDSSKRPSTASTPDALLRGHDGATLRRRARERRIDPRRLLALLRGDLAAIMLKAVAADRTQRYDSAAALAEDLQRLIDHQPVSAISSTRGYRLRRFLRRQRLPVSLAAIAILALIGGLLLALRSAHHAQLARERAEQESQTAQAVAEFFGQRIQADDPGMQCNYAQYTAVGEAAQRSAQSLATRYPGQPRVEVRIRTLLAATLISAGMQSDALEQIRQARKQARQQFGTSAQETLEVELMQVTVYNAVERYSDARALARSVANRASDLLGKTHPIVLSAQLELARTLIMLSDYPQAQRLAERLLPQARHLSKRDGGALFDAVSYTLADAYRMQDLNEQAAVLVEERAQRLKINPGPRSQSTLDALEELALLEIDRENYAQAKQLLETQVIPIYDEFCGTGGRPIGTSRYLAMIHVGLGEYAQAVTVLADVVVGTDDLPEIEQTMGHAIVHHEYATALIGNGQTTLGIEHLLRADRIFARDLPVTEADRQSIIGALASAYALLGQDAEAAKWNKLVVRTTESTEAASDSQ